MGAATRRFPTLLNATDKIAVDDVEEEAGMAYTYSTERKFEVPTPSCRSRRRGLVNFQVKITKMGKMVTAARVKL
jgi:hypothetical protein